MKRTTFVSDPKSHQDGIPKDINQVHHYQPSFNLQHFIYPLSTDLKASPKYCQLWPPNKSNKVINYTLKFFNRNKQYETKSQFQVSKTQDR